MRLAAAAVAVSGWQWRPAKYFAQRKISWVEQFSRGCSFWRPFCGMVVPTSTLVHRFDSHLRHPVAAPRVRGYGGATFGARRSAVIVHCVAGTTEFKKSQNNLW